VGKNYLRVLIAAGVMLLLALPAVLTQSAKPLAAGWDDLAFCLDLEEKPDIGRRRHRNNGG
jgi:hypothetical protein